MKSKYGFMLIIAVASALLQAMTLQTLLYSANLLPGGFTGISVLLEIIGRRIGVKMTKSFWLLALNVPVTMVCWRYIGKKFVIFSLTQILLTSIFLNLIPTKSFFDDILLNICFGGFLYGFSMVLALRGNFSTGGMDFVALYISNRMGKSIWQEVFLFNAMLISVFGFMEGWEAAGYSILFQLISTQTVERFYHRFKRVTLQITTEYPNEVLKKYISQSKHGISVMEGYGGYSKRQMSLLHTVVSVYEVQEIASSLKKVDPKIIINVIPTDSFFGKFYLKPLE